MKNSTKFLLGLLATTSLLTAACGDDVTPGKCDPACTDGQVCNEETGKCEDKSENKCDPACTDGQVCNEETGKCEDKSTSK